MKQGASLYRFVMLLFAGAILLYLGGAGWRAFRDPYPTFPVYSYTVSDTIEATGYLCRSEEVITSSGNGVVRLLPNEGEKVRTGASVALLYSDGQGLERSQRLEALREQVAQIEQVRSEVGVPLQNGSINAETGTALVNLRTSVEAGDFTRLEDQTAQFKQAVYRQALRYNTTGDLDATLNSIKQEIASLESQTSQDMGSVRVSQGGIFSGQADGYESVLQPETIENLTPYDLDTLPGQAERVPANVIGKLITDDEWYFVCPIAEEDAARLTEGAHVTTRFSRDWSGEVEMTVERIGAPQNGRIAVVFSSNRFLSKITLLRRQTVELVFSTKTGIRVPSEAVRVETETRKNPETNREESIQVTCVYVKTGVTADRKPVKVLAQGENYYLVQPVISDEATQEQEKKILRAGDAVVIASQPIWDGKVLG